MRVKSVTISNAAETSKLYTIVGGVSGNGGRPTT